MKILFEGAARMVTGSCYLLESGGRQVLVDCGMRQGADRKDDDGLFAFAPGSIDAVLLTHAHIDHSGLLPLLIQQGFTGKIYTTKVTMDLCSIMLPDSGHIQEMEAEWRTRKAMRAGRPPVEPLYTAQQAMDCLKAFVPVAYGETFEVVPGLMARMTDAGHLLGSAMIEVWMTQGGVQRKLVFSGDIGNANRPIVRDPSTIAAADMVVMESTYGDRLHPPRTDDRQVLAEIIRKTFDRGGNVIIPAFSVGRTQELLYDLSLIMREGMAGLKPFDVYVDSPLSSKATRVFAENFNDGYFDEQAMERKQQGDDPFSFETLHFVETADDSKALNFLKGSKVIISSSGMCEAGRIKHHLKHNLYRPECAVVFPGFQGKGTLGRSIVEGAKHVKIFGEEIEVKADIYRLQGFSGHADQKGLLTWLEGFAQKPQHVLITHGEEEVEEAFAAILQQRGYDTFVPHEGDVFDFLTGETIPAPQRPVRQKAEPAEMVQAGARQGKDAPIEKTEKLDVKQVRCLLLDEAKHMLATAETASHALKPNRKQKGAKQAYEMIDQLRKAAKRILK